MPIRAQHRWLYPINRPQLTDMVRFEWARGRCECCARPHGQLVYHLGDGRWWDVEAEASRSGRGRILKIQPSAPTPEIRTTRVYLATAHLDHDPFNSAWLNLKALCQRCDIVYDRTEHLRRRRVRFLLTRAVGDLFNGAYPTT